MFGAPVFAPYDIVDPSDRFLEDGDKEGGILFLAGSPAQRSRVLWFFGGALCILSPFVFATNLGLWGGLPRGTDEPRKLTRAPIASAFAQFPPPAQHLTVGSAVQTRQIYKPPATGPASHRLAEGQQAPAVGEDSQGDSSPVAVMGSPKVIEEHLRVTSAASIYKGPSDSADLVGTASPGAEGIVVSRESDWVQLADPDTGRTGWIRSAFLAPATEESASTEATLLNEQDLEVTDEGASSAIVDRKPAAKSKHSRLGRHVGRRALRSALRRFLR